MVIKTLLDYCASFHSFKTDKKKLQMGHVTQHHQAINKPPHHTPVEARPAQSCPTAITPSLLVPHGKAGSCLCPAPSCQEGSRSSFLLEAAQQSQAEQLGNAFISSRPSRQEALRMLGRAVSPPAIQLQTGEAALSVPALALSSRQARVACCLLPTPALSKPTGTPRVLPCCHRPSTHSFPASVCSALCPIPCSYQGKGERRWLVEWEEKGQAHAHIKVRENSALS